MKENIYPLAEEEKLYSIVSEKLKHMDSLSGHFNAKLLRIDAQMNMLQDTIRTMVLQYHEFDSIIRDFNVMFAVLGDEERQRFDFVDFDRMQEEQRVRLESIQLLLEVPVPGLPEVAWIRREGVEA